MYQQLDGVAQGGNVTNNCRLMRSETARRKSKMKKIITAAAILGLSATAAFAQSGANPSAPQPGSTGVGVNQPGTTSTGTAVDRQTTGSSMSKDTMSKDSMKKDSMSKDHMKK
jgi:hypothetical protein